MQQSFSRTKQREKQNYPPHMLSSLLLRNAKRSAVSRLRWQQIHFPGSENQNILDFFHKSSLVCWLNWNNWSCPNADGQGGEWRCHVAVDPGDSFQEYHLRGFSLHSWWLVNSHPTLECAIFSMWLSSQLL